MDETEAIDHQPLDLRKYPKHARQNHLKRTFRMANINHLGIVTLASCCADGGNSVAALTRELGHRVVGNNQTDLVADKTSVGNDENADGTFGC